MGLKRPYLVSCGINPRKKDELSCSERTSETNPDLRERLMYIAGEKKKLTNTGCKTKLIIN